jgi:hypothetical protein
MRTERLLTRPLVLGASVCAAVAAFGTTSLHAHADDGPNYTIWVPCAGPGGGPAGLIQAVNQANANGAANPRSRTEIHLAGGCAYVFKSADNSTDGGNALPVIKSNIEIESPDNDDVPNNAIIMRSVAASTPAFRLIDVSSKGALELDSVTLNNGRTPDGTPGGNATSSQPAGNAPDGGAVLSAGALYLDETVVSGNATGKGGDASSSPSNNTSGGNGGNGGGIASSGSLVIYDESSISGNVTGNGGVGGPGTSPTSAGPGGNGGNGGAINASGGTVSIYGSMVSGNVTGDGGVGGSPTGAGSGASGGNGGNGGGVNAPALTVVGTGIQGNLTGAGGQGGTGGAGSSGGPGGNGGDGGGTFTTVVGGKGNLATYYAKVLGNTTGNGGAGGNGGPGGSAGPAGRGGNGGGHAAAAGSTLSLKDGSITYNTTGSGGKGGAVYWTGSSLTINGTTISNNSQPQCEPAAAGCPA